MFVNAALEQTPTMCVVTTKSTRSTAKGTTMKPKPQIKRGMTTNRIINNKYRKHEEQKVDKTTSPSLIFTRQDTNPNH
jgi:hypothetical protein